MPDTESRAYWTELPALLPGRYRHWARLTAAFAVRVSGRRAGRTHRAVLYRETPKGRWAMTWSRRFEMPAGSDPDAVRCKALNLLLDAAKGDPRVSLRLTVWDIERAARRLLEDTGHKTDNE